MLHFAAADMEEGRGNLEAAKQVYEDLAANLAPDTPESEASQARHLTIYPPPPPRPPLPFLGTSPQKKTSQTPVHVCTHMTQASLAAHSQILW